MKIAVTNFSRCKRAEQRPVFVHPRDGFEIGTSGAARVRVPVRGAIHVRDAEFDHAHDVADSRQVLRGGQGDKSPVGVEIVKAGIENPGDAKSARARHHSKRSKPPLRTNQRDVIADL